VQPDRTADRWLKVRREDPEIVRGQGGRQRQRNQRGGGVRSKR